MAHLLQDLRYAFRSLRKKPGFALVAVLTLAVGIGANTAMFSVVNAVLLQPLPFSEPDRLTILFETNLAKGWRQFMVSPPNYGDWRDQSRSFEQVAAYRVGPFDLAEGTEPERVWGARVSPHLFATLGVQPVAGRLLTAEDDSPGSAPVVLVSQALWQRRFGSDPHLVGRTLRISGRSFTVIGILPAGFSFPGRSEMWAPMAFTDDDLRSRGTHFISVVARLRPGVTLEQAQTEMDGIAARLADQYPRSNQGWGARVVPLLEAAVGQVRPALQMLLGAVAFVLLIACANVANLLLARATARQKEIAVRLALGASRGRLMRQLLTESAVLALAGGAAGTLLAYWGVKLIIAIHPGSIPRASQIGVDGWVLAFALAISLVTGIIFGLLPALRASRLAPNETLKEGGRAPGASPSGRRIRHALVAAEVALSLLLLTGAGLLIKSFLRVGAVNPGFAAENVLTLHVSLPLVKYSGEPQRAGFVELALERIRAVPGVDTVGATTTLPFVGDNINGFLIEGRSPLAPNEIPSANYYAVTPDYFRAMGIPLLRGRSFTDQDAQGTPRVVIINQTLAERYFPGEDPVGRRMRITDRNTMMREIVGVVGDVRQYGVEREQTAQMYEPYAQNPLNFVYFAVRAQSDPTALAAPIRRQIAALDNERPVSNVSTLATVVADSVAPRRLNTALLGSFAAVALLLAAVGLYSVTAYSVSQRTHEIGVRMALGAARGDIFRLVVGQGTVPVLIGLVLGGGLALGLTRLLTGLLFDVKPTDPAMLVLAAGVLAAAALVACYVPARRATRVDPLVALRYE